MTAVFADTSFYIALVNPRDALHAGALNFAGAYRGDVLTTEFVLVEVGNWLASCGDRPVFIRLMHTLQSDANTHVIAASTELFAAGFERYARRPDKDWSLTDCISFVVMEQHRLADAATADQHFEQAGFPALLRRAPGQ